MRFVRAFTRADTGELVGVMEQETPFDHHSIDVPDAPGALVMRELGLAEHFDATDLEGRQCSPARHLFLRMERAPAAPSSVTSGAAVHGDLPRFHDVPTSMEGIKAHLRERGAAAIPERVAHWLEFMGALSEEEMEAHGLPRLTPEAADEFDAMRMRRDPSVGPRAHAHKRRIEEREAMKAAKWAAGLAAVVGPGGI